MQPSPVKRLATAADIADLERHEVIGGEIVEKAGPSFEHGSAQGAIAGALFAFRSRGGGDDGRPGGWWLGTEVEVELELHEVYVPDIAGWRIERCPVPPRGKPVRIVPDWVCEILSPSTAGRDIGPKLNGYHRAKVGHHWLVDPINNTLTVHRWSERGYLVVLGAAAGQRVRVEPFEAIELDISDIFGLPPRDER